MLEGPVRNILIKAAPEEFVRQNIVKVLLDKYKYPLSALETEYRIDGKRTRADIVVWLPLRESNKENHQEKAYIVIECKAPGVELTEEHFLQTASYCNDLDATYLAVTNGKNHWIYEYNYKDDIYVEIEDFPNYEITMNEDWVSSKVKQSKIKKPSSINLNNPSWIKTSVEVTYHDWIIGLDTTPDLWSFIIDFYHMFVDSPIFFIKPFLWLGYTIKEDLGTSLHTFGNASGGKFFGRYRSILITDKRGNDQIVRFTILANLKTKNDPTYGTLRGKSMLVVSVCHGETMHNSLQLSLDDFLIDQNELYEVWHNGRMAVGNLGQIKYSRVIDHIIGNEESLVDRSKINLGKIQKLPLLQWEDIKEVILNLAVYSLLRDDLRRVIKKEKASK